jgi:hypothetical protein
MLKRTAVVTEMNCQNDACHFNIMHILTTQLVKKKLYMKTQLTDESNCFDQHYFSSNDNSETYMDELNITQIGDQTFLFNDVQTAVGFIFRENTVPVGR